jgi:histidine ammonia-lyase
MSLDAVEGNRSIVDPAAAAAKPVPGQVESARRIRAYLRGAGPDAGSSEAPNRSVQDPLSFRVAPQVHGAYREFAGFLQAAVDVELSAMDDNPLVVADERRLVSNGNFQPIAMALAVDALRPAIAHVGILSDRRMNHLWTRRLEALEFKTAGGMQLVSDEGGPFLRYAAATRAAELRELAGPATLDIAPLDLGVEDHATNAVTAARRTDEALDHLLDVLAVELVMARQVLRLEGRPNGTGAGTAAAIAAFEAAVPPGPAGAASDRFHAAVRAALFDPILAAAESAISG